MNEEEKVEEQYQRCMRSPLAQAKRIKRAEVVVGIPFYNEAETIGNVFKMAKKGLETFYPEKRCVIICVGAPQGREALKVIEEISDKEVGPPLEKISFLLEKDIEGKGWAVRAIMEIASHLKADLALLSSDLHSFEGVGGISPRWVNLLIEPIKKEGIDFVLPSYNRHYFDAKITRLFAAPLIAAIYRKRITEPIAGEFGISRKWLAKCPKDPSPWSSETAYYGIDGFLTTSAIVNQAKICEVNLGIKFHRASPGKIGLRFRGIAQGIFERMVKDSNFWEGRGEIVSPLDSYGIKMEEMPPEVKINYRELIGRYRPGLNRFHYLYKKILPEEICNHLLDLANYPPEKFELSADKWAKIVFHFLLAFAFDKELRKEDIIDGLFFIFLGRLATFVRVLDELRMKLEKGIPQYSAPLLFREAERMMKREVEEFLRERRNFLRNWKERGDALRPYLPKIGGWEFIPQVPIVVPLKKKKKSGRVAKAQEVHKLLLQRYRKEFQGFISKKLRCEEDASSSDIIQKVRNLMKEVERGLDELLFPGDFHTRKGTEELVRWMFRYFPPKKTFCLKDEVAYGIIRRYPPVTLLTRLGFADLPQLLREYTPSDALALASWSEEWEYMERIWEELRQKVEPSDFDYSEILPLIVSHKDFPVLAEMKEQSALNKLTARILVSDLPKAKGGEFPKIRYFTTIAKSIVEAERFGQIWEEFSQELEFGRRLINSLKGHWGRAPLSAHNIFENGNQRRLVERIREMASKIKDLAAKDGNFKGSTLALRIEDLANSYHLALTLSDNRFIPLSAWTWASYSFKGGHGLPTPLSSHVERDWTSYDFLVEYLKAAELGDESAVEKKVVELMGEGRESEDLARHLLGLGKEGEKILIDQVSTLRERPAGKLKRLTKRPIIEPIKGNFWESKFVFNCATVRLKERNYILYRAVGDDPLASYIGLAWEATGGGPKSKED